VDEKVTGRENAMIPTRAKCTAAILILISFLAARSSAQMNSKASEADSAAVKQVVAAYDEAFNQHDAHAVGALFAEEGDFTNMRGASKHGRADIEQNYGNLFNGVLKSSHRTDTLKTVRFLTPEIAQLDASWEMTGTKGPDGAEVPMRKGGLDWIVAKVNGKWLIVVFHESEYPR
jgi:uncharacterized protein (TIGR02246 family)